MGGSIDVREPDHHHHHLHSNARSLRCKDKPHRLSATLAGGGADDGGPVRTAAGESVSTTAGDHGEGYGQFRRRSKGPKFDSDSSYGSFSPIEANSITMEFRRSSCKRASGTPIRALIDEEVSREMEVRRSSPSVIARLMGLDTLPPPQTSHKQHKETSTTEQQEFKDVFEVMESSKSEKHKNQIALKGMQYRNKNENELNPRSQNFMDAKHLSTEERPQICKESNDALEGVDSEKDLFLKFLQEPSSLFSRHLQDLKCFQPSPQPNHIILLRSSKGTNNGGNSDICMKSERKGESYGHSTKDISSSRVHTPNLASHSLKENDSYLQKLLKSKNTSKADSCLHPTRIVLLKPSLEKAQQTASNVSLPRSTEILQCGFVRHKESHLSAISELHGEGRGKHKLFDKSQVMRHKIKGSREIAREITEQMRLRHIRDESPSGNSYLNKASQRTLDNFDDSNNNYHPSTSYSSESSMSKEARKRLSDRWKRTHRAQEVGFSGRGASTLGEMLALSDTETPRRTSDSSVLAIQGGPLGISSRSGWKDGCLTNIPRSTSLPAPLTGYGIPKPRNRHSDSGSGSDSSDNCDLLKDVLNFEPNDSLHGYSIRRRSPRRRFKCGSDKRQSFHAGGEENKIPVWKINVKMEETRNRTLEHNLAEENKSVDVELACRSSDEQVQQPPKYVESSATDRFEKSIQEASCIHLQEDTLLSRHNRVESGPLVSSKETEQPSPISVLDPPSEEETSTPQCFEKLSADLQGLRMQLQLLKLESEEPSGDDDPQMLVSDEETGSEHNSSIEHAFRDNEERDFSYLLDVLASSGIKNGADKDRLFNACYLPEYPVDPAAFERLEKKHCESAAWTRSERKLLFDHINSVLAEMLAPCMDLHPWVKLKRRLGPVWPPRGLAEVALRIVVRERKELCRGNPDDKVLDVEWLGVGNDVDMIGREIERMLKEELLEELVSEFILPRCNVSEDRRQVLLQ